MTRSRIIAVIACVLALALGMLIRFPALSQPYHQDEYKWAFIVNPVYGQEGTIPHPPLAEILYHHTGALFGYDHLRLLPYALSLVFSILLYVVVARLYGKRAAIIALLLWAIDLYAVLASVQIDIDGVLLPICILSMLGGYLLWKKEGRSRLVIALLSIGIIGGAFTKLSFVLAPGAIAADLLWQERFRVRQYLTRRVLIGTIAALVVVIALVFALRHAPLFVYAERFMHFGGRSYFELFFLTTKAILYLSPLLILGSFLGLKHLKTLSVWYWYVLATVLFYAVVFDFTHTTLDRYWMALILPLVVITAVALGDLAAHIRSTAVERIMTAGGALVVALLVLKVFTMGKTVMPLQPKDAFIHSFLSGHWSFLIPFSGGSGPLGFYLPLDGIMLLWGIAAVSAALLFFVANTRIRFIAIVLFIVMGIFYNTIGVVEYEKGYLYGSTSGVYTALVARVNNDPTIPQVITYNDVGGYDLTVSKKYFKRFYTDPMFADTNVGKFGSYNGYYMVLDMPLINTQSVYWQYFQKCKSVFDIRDKQVSGFIFDCRGVAFDQ